MRCHTLTASSPPPSRSFAAGSNSQPPDQEAHRKEQVPRRRYLVGSADLLHQEGGVLGGYLVWGAPLISLPPPTAHTQGSPSAAQGPAWLSRFSPGLEAKRWMPVPTPLRRLLESPSPECRAEKGQGHHRSVDQVARPGHMGRCG